MDVNSRLKKCTSLNMRMNSEQKTLIETAANLNGQNFSSFVLSTILEASREMIKLHLVTKFSAEEYEELNELLEADEEPTEYLKVAAKSFQKFINTGVWEFYPP
jgi:uncharacterized protein (DUF1778 family)